MTTKFMSPISRFIIIGVLFCQHAFAQNSVLVNFGGNACNNSTTPFFSLIKNPLSAAPVLLSNCSLAAQMPDVYSVFIAYNPKNNKLYVADIRDGLQTKIWLLDIGLPVNISCPSSIPVAPTYAYSYISNNFEFDNNGDLWSFSGYNSTTGTCNMDKFDVNTGTVINTRVLQFPAGNFPTTIQSGDLTILPNGRMFASLGSGTCRLYEITDYSSTSGSATATYLRTLPKDCYGIAYLNGILELAGSNFSGSCYYYGYNIATGILDSVKVFQNGQAPIDNTSFTPSVGATKRLLSAAKINSNTADLTYEVYTENLGNVVLNNVNVTDDLVAAFGAGNVSNVSAGFVAGSNGGGLILNPAFNGTTITNLLNPGQNLPNKVLANRDYFFKLLVNCRVTNLNGTTTYLNTAIATGEIGAGNALSLVNVSDSSNNGDSTVVDPNKNGNAADMGENVPTPFLFSILPVKFVTIDASLLNKTTALVKWQVATPLINAAKFEVEYSIDGRIWQRAGIVMIADNNRSNYQFSHLEIPFGNLYYRVKQTDKDGTFTYSRIVLLHNKNNSNSYVIYPNPANNYIDICAVGNAAGNAEIELYDVTGRKLLSKPMITSTHQINTTAYPRGAYLLKICNEGNVVTKKLFIQH